MSLEHEALNKRLVNLLSKCARSDEQAFKEVYELTAARLLAVLAQALGTTETAEQALQDTFVKIWLKVSEYGVEKGQPLTWLSAIARSDANEILHHRRRSGAALALSEPIRLLNETAQINFIDKSKAAQSLENALNKLDPLPRDCIVRAYAIGQSHEELGELHDTSIAGVKEWVRNGLLSLTECVNGRHKDLEMGARDSDWWLVHTGEYVLGLLEEQDIIVFERVLQHEPAVEKIVADWADLFQPLSNSLTPIEPSAYILSELLEHLPSQASQSKPQNGPSNSVVDLEQANGAAKTVNDQNTGGIANGTTLVKMAGKNEQQSGLWQSLAGLIVAACLLLSLYFFS